MTYCQYCNTPAPDPARFCPKCGLPLQTVHHVNENGSDYKPIFPLDFKDLNSLPAQIKSFFLKALQQKLEKEIPAARFNDFVDRFYSSDFKKEFDNKSLMLAEVSTAIHSKKESNGPAEIDNLIQETFDPLLDHFVVYYCQDLSGTELPTSIVEYENVVKEELDIQKMVEDYLDLDKENLKYYTDTEQLSTIKLQNATRNFLFAPPNEQVLLLCDQSVYGSCREGFAFTDAGIYWRSHFKQAHQVQYVDLKILEWQNEALNINNLLFDVSESVNTKLLLLLKKMKELYA